MLQKTSLQFPKKAVLLKNCSNILNSKNENPIKLPSGEKKPPEVPFNRLSFLVLQTKRKLSYCTQCFYSHSFSLLSYSLIFEFIFFSLREYSSLFLLYVILFKSKTSKIFSFESFSISFKFSGYCL